MRFTTRSTFLPKYELEHAGVRIEVISLDSKPIEIYSYFSRIGALDVDKTISDADPSDYVAQAPRSRKAHTTHDDIGQLREVIG